MTDLKKNVPELRFPEFSGEWEEKKLGEIVSFGKGKLLGKKDLTEDGKYLCILYGELYTKYGAIINNIESRTNVDPSKLKKAENNQILIPSSGETVEDIATASAINVTEDVYIGGDLNILTPQKDDGRFISLSLNSVNKWNVSRFAQGKTVVHLYNSDLKNLKINLPCQFEEQQKIGDFFSKLDHQIELEEQKLALLEEQKKGYMQKIFSQELRFKDENGENYPEWEEQKLDNIANIGTGKSKVKNTGGNYDVLGSTGIIGKSNNYDYEGDFILIARVGHYAGSLYKYSGKVNITDNTIYLKSNIVLEFIYYSLKRYRISRLVFGSGQPLLKSSDIKQLKLFISGEKEQQKIGDFFSKLDRHIELQGKKIELLKQRKQGFLQKMFV
ncbi:TPA: restriction endonuclease subunit S [Staphylococcus delphini]|nr:restriction endonuclease subunit S [Staphylococcus delphini]